MREKQPLPEGAYELRGETRYTNYVRVCILKPKLSVVPQKFLLKGMAGAEGEEKVWDMTFICRSKLNLKTTHHLPGRLGTGEVGGE